MFKIKKFIPFPKISQPNEIKMDMDIFSIELLYPCGLPEVFCDMIACDRRGKWYHRRCSKDPPIHMYQGLVGKLLHISE